MKCYSGKTYYRTPNEAKRALRCLKHFKRISGGNGMHVYHCTACKGFHLGHRQ